MRDFEKLKRIAEEKGWRLPKDGDVFGPASWVNYWKQCQEYERNPESGRPVVPHRPA